MGKYFPKIIKLNFKIKEINLLN